MEAVLVAMAMVAMESNGEEGNEERIK